ncbi:MAG: diaminopimelate epimerase [Bacteroidales bacterium]|nr:diaminopimelate epimerase [Bacteroidales bacterium]
MFKFYKYHGAGNDFVLIDNFNDTIFNFTKSDIQKICDRNFGIGADGLMILKKHHEYDFEMDYYNSDGSGGTMCGNGGRCIVAFAEKLGLINNYAKFLASDGVHEAYIYDGNSVKLKMTDVENISKAGEDYICYTGSPHYIKFENDIAKKDVFREGREIRYSDTYKKEGINVNFIKVNNDNTLNIRTYERGVEAETFACGTGAVASALSFANLNGNTSGEYLLHAKGGKLKVSFNKKDNKYVDIWLTGPVQFVFEGRFTLDILK